MCQSSVWETMTFVFVCSPCNVCVWGPGVSTESLLQSLSTCMRCSCCVCMYVGVPCGGQRSASGAFLSCSPPNFFEVGCFPEQRAHHLSRLAMSSRDLPVSALPQHWCSSCAVQSSCPVTCVSGWLSSCPQTIYLKKRKKKKKPCASWWHPHSIFAHNGFVVFIFFWAVSSVSFIHLLMSPCNTI